MIFGDKDSFAVEAELNQDYGGASLFGKVCYWIGGLQIGNYDEGATLSDLVHDMIWLVHDCGKRDGGILCTMTTEAAFSTIDKLLYESDECDSGVKSTPLDTPARFEITTHLDVFSDWKLYLFECGETAIVLLRKDGAHQVKVVTIPVGAFDHAIKAAHSWLYDLDLRERARS
jgi:hypothetical protein